MMGEKWRGGRPKPACRFAREQLLAAHLCHPAHTPFVLALVPGADNLDTVAHADLIIRGECTLMLEASYRMYLQ